MTWTAPQSKFGLIHLDVDARLYSGDEENDFGFVCDALDQDNYYFMVISSDGCYGIREARDGTGRLIGMEAMLPREAILFVREKAGTI